MLFAQTDVVPGVGEAIHEAGKASGYEGILIVTVIAVLLTMFMLIVKWSLKGSDKRLEEAFKREERMALRINDLEGIVQNNLIQLAKDCVKAIQDNTLAMARLIQVFDNRLCVLDAAKQDALIEKFTNKLTECAKETING